MTYKESLPLLEGVLKRYDLVEDEKEAIRMALYVCKKKAESEKPECLFYVDKYYFHSWRDALTAAKKFKCKHILEKRSDSQGNMITKKYTILNGKILGVHNM